jgi:hypothetical protein
VGADAGAHAQGQSVVLALRRRDEVVTIEARIAACWTAVADTSSTSHVPDRAKWLVFSSLHCA